MRERTGHIALFFLMTFGIAASCYCAETVVLSADAVSNRQIVPGEMIIEIKRDIIDLGKGKGRVLADAAVIGSEMLAVLSKRYKLISIEHLFSGTRKDAPSEIYIFRFSPTVDIDEVISAYKKDPNVVYAEPNYVMHTMKN